VQGQPLAGFLRGTVTQDFRLDGVSVRPPSNASSSSTISGQVFNIGDKAATFVKITAAIYDKDGTLYQVEETIAKLQEIAPGQSAPFEITPTVRVIKEISKYDLFVEGRPK